MHLLRYISVLLLCLCCFASGALAQQRKVQHKPFIDERRFHYGFTFGLHDQGLSLENNGYVDPETGAQWLAENDRPGVGFSVGVLGEWKLNQYFALRLIPSLHFGSKHIEFRNLQNGETVSQDLKSSYIALPFDIKAAAPRFNNYRPYVLAGIQPMLDLTSATQGRIRTQPMNFMVEVGMGCDLYLPFFKLIPELKFCFGLGNVLDKKRTDLNDPTKMIFTQSLNGASVSMVVLSFYFE